LRAVQLKQNPHALGGFCRRGSIKPPW